MSPFFIKRLLRSPARNIAVLLVCALLAGVACYLFVYRENQLERLDEVKDSARVLCVVTDFKGTSASSLRMGYGGYSAVTDKRFYELPKFVSDLRAAKEFSALSPVLGADEADLFAVLNPNGIELLDPALGGGTDLVGPDFYCSDKDICIVSQEVYYKLGEDKLLEVTVTDPFPDRYFFPDKGVGKAEFTAVGYYFGEGGTVFIPFETGMKLAERISGVRSLDSVSFIAADNRRLDEMRQAALESFGTAEPYADHPGEHRFALAVHDEELKGSVAAIEQNIRRAEILLPLSLISTLAAGFLLGFVSTRSEKHTYALQRSVGTKKPRLVAGIMTEQLLPALIASAAAALVFRAPLPACLAFILYAAGCLAAVIRAVSTAPARLLCEND